MIVQDSCVYVQRCDDYDTEILKNILSDGFRELGIGSELFKEKKVLVKANFVMPSAPECAVTSHPRFIEAIGLLMKEYGAARTVLADSPGGSYNSATLSHTYKHCCVSDLDSSIIALNEDFSFTSARYGGKYLKNFNTISVFNDADVIIDLCKLKTHSFTSMSCAVKNLFGIIPGTQKFEMHSNFPELDSFSGMLADLCAYVSENKKLIAVCDAVLSLEGNGPTHGIPKRTGLVLISESAFSLDIVAEHIMKLDGKVRYLDIASENELVSRDFDNIPISGLSEIPVFDFVFPESGAGFVNKLPNLFGGKAVEFFRARPKVDPRKCVGCGNCLRSCPRKTITMRKTGGKQKAHINNKGCIRCYCCQELCPVGAVDVRRNPILKLIN